MTQTVDSEAILCALALAPGTYSRNRFFSLYEAEDMGAIRRRASLIRSLVRHASRTGAAVDVSDKGPIHLPYLVTIDIAHLNFRRSTRLSALELSLFRYMHARAERVAADEDRARIEAALLSLAGPIAVSPI